MASAFISYKHEEVSRQFVEKLKARLVEAGFIWWIDEDLRYGDKWKDAINSAIEQAFVILLIVSRGALASDFIKYEWAYALGAKKRIIPILIEPIDIETLHPVLKDIQLAHPFINFNDAASEDWERLISQLRVIQQEDDIPLQALRAREMLLTPMPRNEIYVVANALRTLQHPAGERFLDEAVRSPFLDVSMIAAIALAIRTNYQSTRPLPGLKSAIYDNGLAGEALNALKLMNSEPAIECLWEVYSDRSSSDRVKQRVTECLVDMKATFQILEILRQDRSLDLIFGVLQVLRVQEAVDDLIACGRRNSSLTYEYRVALIKALGACSPPDAPKVVDFLVEFSLENQMPSKLSNAAFEIFKSIGGDYTLEVLSQLRHTTRYLQFHLEAIEAINAIKAIRAEVWQGDSLSGSRPNSRDLDTRLE